MVRTESSIARVRAAMRRVRRATPPAAPARPVQRMTPVVARTMTKAPRATR